MVFVKVMDFENSAIARVYANNSDFVYFALSPIATCLSRLALVSFERWVPMIRAKISLSLEVYK
jgi:hypothetical protein